MYWKMIFKSPRFVQFEANLTYFETKSDILAIKVQKVDSFITQKYISITQLLTLILFCMSFRSIFSVNGLRLLCDGMNIFLFDNKQVMFSYYSLYWRILFELTLAIGQIKKNESWNYRCPQSLDTWEINLSNIQIDLIHQVHQSLSTYVLQMLETMLKMLFVENEVVEIVLF